MLRREKLRRWMGPPVPLTSPEAGRTDARQGQGARSGQPPSPSSHEVVGSQGSRVPLTVRKILLLSQRTALLQAALAEKDV